MKDVLSEFEEKTIKAPTRVRLIGSLRVLSIILMVLFIAGLIFQITDLTKVRYSSYFIFYPIVLLLGIVTVIAIVYSFKQIVLEFSLNTKCYEKSRLRWASNTFHILVLVGVAYIYLLPSRGFIIPAPLDIIFSIVCLISLIMLAVDLQYIFKFKRRDLKNATKKPSR